MLIEKLIAFWERIYNDCKRVQTYSEKHSLFDQAFGATLFVLQMSNDAEISSLIFNLWENEWRDKFDKECFHD